MGVIQSACSTGYPGPVSLQLLRKWYSSPDSATLLVRAVDAPHRAGEANEGFKLLQQVVGPMVLDGHLQVTCPHLQKSFVFRYTHLVQVHFWYRCTSFPHHTTLHRIAGDMCRWRKRS